MSSGQCNIENSSIQLLFLYLITMITHRIIHWVLLNQLTLNLGMALCQLNYPSINLPSIYFHSQMIGLQFQWTVVLTEHGWLPLIRGAKSSCGFSCLPKAQLLLCEVGCNGILLRIAGDILEAVLIQNLVCCNQMQVQIRWPQSLAYVPQKGK